MTKIQVVSDIHVEHYGGKSRFLPIEDAEVIVFAGDVAGNPAQAKKFFTGLREKTNAVFLYVLGNHEYFYQVFANTVKKYKKALSYIENIYVLDKQSYRYKDICFSGGTLWTDYDKERGIPAALYGMIDFELIYKNKTTIIDPYTIIKEHKKQIKFFETRRITADEKHVFITHHMPSFSLIPLQYKNSFLNPCFAADLDDLILDYKPNFWICGHTHGQFETQIGDTSIICNPIGYPRESLPVKEKAIVL